MKRHPSLPAGADYPRCDWRSWQTPDWPCPAGWANRACLPALQVSSPLVGAV